MSDTQIDVQGVDGDAIGVGVGGQGNVVGKNVRITNNYYAGYLKDPNAASRAAAEPEKLPYLCNRRDQEENLRAIFDEHLMKTPSRPIMCVLYGDSRQAHDAFFVRLHGHSLPRRLKGMDRDGVIRFLRVPKPLVSRSPNDFAPLFRSAIVEQMQGRDCATAAELLQQFRDARVRLIATVLTLYSSESSTTGLRYLELVRDFWAGLPDLPGDLILLSFVSVKLDPGESTTWGGKLGALLPWSRTRQVVQANTALRTQIENFEKNPGASDRVRCAVLPELKSPKKHDVAEWLMHPEVMCRRHTHVGDERLNKIFEGRDSIPMDDMLDQLPFLLS